MGLQQLCNNDPRVSFLTQPNPSERGSLIRIEDDNLFEAVIKLVERYQAADETSRESLIRMLTNLSGLYGSANLRTKE